MPHDHDHHHGHSHGHGHHHHHHHDVDLGGDRRLAWAVAINILLTVVQIVAGLFAGSLALIADAVHNLSDALSMVIAWAARRIARRPADASMTFGYGRAEVVAALINYTTLITIAVLLGFQGIEKLFAPEEVQGWTVVVVAAVALVIDTGTALLILRHAKEGVNMRAAFLHNVADALGSVAVIVGGVLILLYDWRLVDPIVTLGISAYILWHAGSEIGPVIRLLMLGSPESPTVEEVAGLIRATDGVRDVHHLHLWRMQEHEVALEAHVVLEEGGDPAGPARTTLKARLQEQFGLSHITIEIETPGQACPDARLIGH
ncbi:cation diffusion facilitator family transporter [Pseudooceanicola sp. CBS1P-1]|uniref:Cation diffusion facilitator family transporter n=1 Tax=Pseudooceanicola albus TaxID=2692189 RepID=A0A6L7FZ80_9RHOB|nr:MULTISPECIES: cation diffusion facilitator family transporter [Pseudooceanicola]MBT9384020.1 cation diffusion facilitator family transporter [Pseudooceanicola endophyticus]MXN16568.1 cation diffusion facilitator family transporter [Pseudooceanicola albus]